MRDVYTYVNILSPCRLGRKVCLTAQVVRTVRFATFGTRHAPSNGRRHCPIEGADNDVQCGAA